MVKNLPSVQEIWVQSLCREDPLEQGLASQASILAWRISWTEESGGLYSSWGWDESDMTEATDHTHMIKHARCLASSHRSFKLCLWASVLYLGLFCVSVNKTFPKVIGSSLYTILDYERFAKITTFREWRKKPATQLAQNMKINISSWIMHTPRKISFWTKCTPMPTPVKYYMSIIQRC